jgi:hypothetical protein
MLDFLVLSLPRSGSTWCSNWLTTDTTFCLHDPLSHRNLADLETASFPNRQWGAACTFLWMFPEWCQEHASRILILDRDVNEVQDSLKRIGISGLPDAMIIKFKAMPGRRVPYQDLFHPETAHQIWEYLRIEAPFDRERHRLLCEMTINPNLAKWRPDKKIMHALIEQLRSSDSTCKTPTPTS